MYELLNIGVQTYVLDGPVDERLPRGPNELRIGSSILILGGGTDANAPKSPQKAILRGWHVGKMGPRIWENLGKWTQRKKEHMKNEF